MYLNIILEKIDYNIDEYDTLKCPVHISYANMFKQLTNNAIKFGIFNNILWILGKTNWKTINGRLEQNTDIAKQLTPYLKLICVKFSSDSDNNLVLDLSTIKYFTINDEDSLQTINQFVGIYSNTFTKNIQIFLYDKQRHLKDLFNNSFYVNFTDIWNDLFNTKIPFKLFKYNINNAHLQYEYVYINNVFPLTDFCKQEILINLPRYKQKGQNQLNLISNIINKPLSGNINNNTLYALCNISNNEYLLSGNIYNEYNDVIDTIYSYFDQNNIQYDINNQLYIFQNIILRSINSQKYYSDSQFIFKLLNNNISFIQKTNQYNYIWKLLNTNDNIYIAYQGLNNNISDKTIYNGIVTKSKNYFIGLIQIKCHLNNSLVYSNTFDSQEIFISNINKIQVNYIYDEIYIFPDSQFQLKILQSKYPNCYLESDKNILTIQTLLTTMGGVKTDFTNPPNNSVLNILSTCISTNPSGIIGLELSGNFIQNKILIDNQLYNFKAEPLTTTLMGYTYQQILDRTIYIDTQISLYKDIFNSQIMQTIPVTLTGTLQYNENNQPYNVYSTLYGHIKTTELDEIISSSNIDEIYIQGYLNGNLNGQLGAIEKLKRLLSSNCYIINQSIPEFNELSKYVYLSSGISEVNSLLSGKYTIDNSLSSIFENGCGLDFTTVSSYSLIHNELVKFYNFIPIIANCIVQPLKIIVNFGNYNKELNVGQTSFDLDISVFIDTIDEKDKKVGWRCGHINTNYLNWITNDNTSGGPEIVLVNINSYIFDHYLDLKFQNKLDIIVNACWYDMSNIISNNANIIVSWRGLSYQINLTGLLYNSNCCNNNVLKITVDLINNTFLCTPIQFIPVIIQSGQSIKNGGYNFGFAYIKVTPEFIDQIYNNINNLKNNVNIYGNLQSIGLIPIYKDNISTYYILPTIKLCKNITEVNKVINQFLNKKYQFIFFQKTLSYEEIKKIIVQNLNYQKKIKIENNNITLTILSQQFFDNIYFV